MTDRSGRFAVVPTRALDDTRMTPAALRALTTICAYANRDGWCWPKVETLARRIGVTRQAMSRQIQVLAEWGYLEVRERWGDKGQMPSLYRVLHDNPLPRTFDRWRPGLDDGEAPEDFAQPLAAASDGEQPEVAHPAVSNEASAVSNVASADEQRDVAPNTPKNTPENTPPDPELVAQTVADGLAARPGGKPLVNPKTVLALAGRALAAGWDPPVVADAVARCRAFTTAGFELALGEAQPPAPTPPPPARPPASRPDCDTCGGTGWVDLDDNGVVRCECS